MTRTMRDSTTAADIPHHGLDLAAGYRNGTFEWSDADWQRFPGIPHVYIDVNGTHAQDAGVLDVETGDATVATAVTWTTHRLVLKPGYPPVIYCNRSTLTPLFNAMNANGLQIVKHFRLWVATLDGTKTLPDMTGVTAVQYAGEKQTGGHYDESIVYDDAWHAATGPAAHKRTTDGVTTWAQYAQSRGSSLQGFLERSVLAYHDSAAALGDEIPKAGTPFYTAF